MTTVRPLNYHAQADTHIQARTSPKVFNTVAKTLFDTYDWYPAAYDDEEGNAMKDRELIQYERLVRQVLPGRWALRLKKLKPRQHSKVHGIMALKAYPEALLEIRLIEMP